MDDVQRQIAAEAIRAARGGDGVLVATIIDGPAGGTPAAGAKLLLRPDGSQLGSFGGGTLEAAIVEDCREALGEFPRIAVQARYYLPEAGRITRLEAKGGADAYEVMIEIIEPSATLLIVGGGHIGLSLATIGAHCGFSVVVVDDREMYANPERFPMADKTLAGDVEQILHDLPIGGVMVSRGHKIDEQALRATVARGASYVGMIGSKRRVATVLRHMAEEGIDLAALEAVYTPIGFDIGAETPEEIAVSIMAEIIKVRRRGSGRPMREGRPAFRPGVPEPLPEGV
jgi:xanthine dehydrogenase accessory factor